MTKIFTSGKMSGLSLSEQIEWRNEAEHYLTAFSDEHPRFIHPPSFYNYTNDKSKCEREIKDFDLNQIRGCDILLVNLKDVETSVGTMMELQFADSMNRLGNKYIWIIGFGDNKGIHPWINLCLHRHEDNLEDACRYIAEFLLN